MIQNDFNLSCIVTDSTIYILKYNQCLNDFEITSAINADGSKTKKQMLDFFFGAYEIQ